MHLANEILRFLLCEICFENYDEKKRLPHTLFPCGHSFCESCINNIQNGACPCCNAVIQSKTKNWAVINLIPKAKIPDVYYQVNKIIDSGLDVAVQCEEFNKINNQNLEGFKAKFDSMRSNINKKAYDLIEKIRQINEKLLEEINQTEIELQQSNTIQNENRQNSFQIISDMKSRLNLEEVKTDETILNEYKTTASNELNILNENLILCKTSQTLNIEFVFSSFDFEKISTAENIFGTMRINKINIEKSPEKINEDEIYNEIPTVT
jgi:hypothetical protein